MQILLDENFPADFADLLPGHEVSTVHSLGWSGVKNGELLRRAQEVCEVFVTLDRNLKFQQNIKVLPFGIVVVRSRSNRMADLRPHIASILSAANRVESGQVEYAGAQHSAAADSSLRSLPLSFRVGRQDRVFLTDRVGKAGVTEYNPY